MLNDLRHAIRMLRNNPVFTAVAVATLALCIGANLTIFAAVDAILLRPLPFPQSDRLAIMYNIYPKAGIERNGASLTNYYERRGQIPAFSSISMLNETTATVGETGATALENIGRVTPEFFATLGVNPVMGRAFTEHEMTYQTDQVAILTDAFWREHFNADPNVLGRAVRTDGLARKIIAVLPPSFSFLSSRARIFLPLSSDPDQRAVGARHSNGLLLIGRLKPGATLAQAQSEVDADNAARAAEFPRPQLVAAAAFRTIVASLHGDHVTSIRPTLILMQAGVLILLLIGAVNFANLLLVRASDRAKELAVRQALGARRRHLIQLVMVETLLLTVLGGLFGLGVANSGIRLLMVLGVDQLPLGAQIAFDWRLALVALIGVVAIGGFVGLPIAWFNIKHRLVGALQSESRSGTSTRAAQRLRQMFMIAQIALAFMLLTGAGLLGLSLQRAMAISPGFSADHLLSGQFNLPWKGYKEPASLLSFADRLLEEISHQPGVSSAGIVTRAPFGGGPANVQVIMVVGYAPKPGASIQGHLAYAVTGDYFTAMKVPLLEGRFLNAGDSHHPQLLCAVDENFSRHYWPNGGAIGQQVIIGSERKSDSKLFTIVGVVGLVKQTELTEHDSVGAIYFPFSQFPDRNNFVVVRTSYPPESFGATLQGIVRQIDPDLALSDVRSMDARIDNSLTPRRSPTVLAAVFGAVALLLAAIGTYGVLAYAVSQRRREIGVRMALGALPQQVLVLFMGMGAKMLVIGIVLGVLGVWVVGRFMQSILFGVPAIDLEVLVAAALIMTLVVLSAVFIPSRRAANIHPMEALRCE